MGVIQTGRLNDGTAGPYEVKRHGGITIVQDPSDAMCPAMPMSALKHVAVDHCVPPATDDYRQKFLNRSGASSV